MTLAEVIAAGGSSSWAAERCLEMLSELPVEDPAFAALAVATQTYGLLAIAEALGPTGAGYSVGEAVLVAGGVQP